MARNTYPRIGHAQCMAPQRKKHGPDCAYCQAPATHRITLQVNHLRGEDESADVCTTHSQKLPAEGSSQ